LREKASGITQAIGRATGCSMDEFLLLRDGLTALRSRMTHDNQ
jgi:hypothetical protein